MFERLHQPLLPMRKFVVRLAYSLLSGLFLIVITLCIGMSGYHYFEQMTWLDSFVNAAMILSSMGPLSQLHNNSGKLFAGFYAIFCGIAFVLTIGIILTPIFHRFFHKFHLD